MKNIVLIVPLLFLNSFVSAQQNKKEVDALVSPKKTENLITIGGQNADISSFNNQSIQFGIDAVTKTGGTVKLNPGTYNITSPIRMQSNVKLVGSGDLTILKRDRSVQTPFIIDADYGELKLTVENSDGFEIGMKIQVTDNTNGSCWGVSTAYITDVRENIIYIDDYLKHDYRSDKGGLITNSSSVIEILGAENVIVADLVVDGNRSENHKADGCNSGGICIIKSKKITVDNVLVKDFNGEGITWQITENVTIRNSEITGNGNTGLHPGSGSPFSIIENNNIHHNDVDGLFICWRVYQSQVRSNKIHHNGRYGICTGHKDTDVIFDSNHIFNNENDGINLRGEREANAPHRNTFLKNIIENNGTGGQGNGFTISSPAKDLLLKENVFLNSGKTQKIAIYVDANGAIPKLENNLVNNQALDEVVIEKEKK